jgi:hypothetical protein
VNSLASGIEEPSSRVRGFVPLVIAGGAAVLLIGWAVWAGTTDRRHSRLDEENVSLTYLDCRPGPTPRALAAESARLPDDAPVIGVVAGGKARAYALSGFSDIDDHVLNDVVGGHACTVTYCPLSGCTRVFVDPVRQSPLGVSVGGWMDRRGDGTDTDTVMLLRVDRDYYFHDSGEAVEGEGSFPYSEADFVSTTWGRWRGAHPNTDIVTGPHDTTNPAQGRPRRLRARSTS